MEQGLVATIVILGVVCLVWLAYVSFRTFCLGAGAALAAFGAIYLAGPLGAAHTRASTMLGVVCGEAVFLVVCPVVERRLRRQGRERARRYAEDLVDEAKRRRRSPDEMRRYRTPD
ncbi:hypothetical protein [Micromonospora sp. URMC 103]|uniref:hypothetical protein n=1 Tax=Micromonospora sp. URMC 103 TaxID=3423406 RepID=UPI003F1B5923